MGAWPRAWGGGARQAGRGQDNGTDPGGREQPGCGPRGRERLAAERGAAAGTEGSRAGSRASRVRHGWGAISSPRLAGSAGSGARSVYTGGLGVEGGCVASVPSPSRPSAPTLHPRFPRPLGLAGCTAPHPRPRDPLDRASEGSEGEFPATSSW